MKTSWDSLLSHASLLYPSQWFRSFAVLYAVLLLSTSVDAAPSQCIEIFSESQNIELSVLQWEGQVQLRKDRQELNNLDGLSYSYTTAKDALNYEKLSSLLYSRLSKAEVSMLDTYTAMSGHEHELLNSNISKKEQLKGAKATRVQTLLAAFDKGILLPEGLLLFRGIGGDNINIPAVGKTMKWDRLTSTSMNPETARYFTSHEGADSGILMVIEVSAPVKALLSKNPHEMEFLLAPDVQFTVISKKRIRSEDILIVHLKAF